MYKWYYKGGELEGEGHYKDGKREGLHKEYYKSSAINFIDTYKNGIMINRKRYDERGKLEFDKDYPTE